MQESDGLRRETFIINAALTRMLPSRSDTRYVPLALEDIAEEAAPMAEAGTAILHFHPRDAEGSPSRDQSLFGEVIGAVREGCPDVIFCGTCSGRLESDLERRAACLMLEGDLKLDIGSLGTSPATGLDRALMVNALPEGTIWAAAGIGRYQPWANTMALAMGGNVEVGIENNLYYYWQEKGLVTNRMLLEQPVRTGRELGRQPATCQEARELLGLPPRGTAS